LRFGFPLLSLGLDEFTRGSIRYAYDDADLYNIQETAALEIKEMEGRNVTSSVSLSITRDSKDRPFLTTEGSVNSLSFETAGGFLGGDVGFYKYLATTAWYFPLFWKTVFIAQGRWGYIDDKSGEKLPVYHKFRIGGINTVRGFDDYSITPRDITTGDPIGGNQMLIFNVEYRFPLIQEQGIVGLVFFDAGNVFTDDPNAYTISGLRMGVGLGVRWYSPVGPIRVEYGFNLDPDPGTYVVPPEPSGRYHFSVGAAF